MASTLIGSLNPVHEKATRSAARGGRGGALLLLPTVTMVLGAAGSRTTRPAH